ncbi:Tolloid-like protein 2, partial [Geodia barretti]
KTTHQCDIDNGGCSYMCETDDSGIGNCICQAGFKVNKSGGCRDINECQTNSHGCEQNCQNTQGSYQCICNEGYALHIDKKHCTRCEEVYNVTQGVVEPTGYPGPYHDHQNCLYKILIHPEHVLKLTIRVVNIQYSDKCRKEFLKMQHGHFKNNRRLCHYISNISYYIRDSNDSELNFNKSHVQPCQIQNSTLFM